MRTRAGESIAAKLFWIGGAAAVFAPGFVLGWRDARADADRLAFAEISQQTNLQAEQSANNALNAYITSHRKVCADGLRLLVSTKQNKQSTEESLQLTETFITSSGACPNVEVKIATTEKLTSQATNAQQAVVDQQQVITGREHDAHNNFELLQAPLGLAFAELVVVGGVCGLVIAFKD